MKFDSNYPKHALIDELGYERLFLGSLEQCSFCEETCQWLLLFFSCPCCSYDCARKLKEEFFEVMLNSLERVEELKSSGKDEIVALLQASQEVSKGEKNKPLSNEELKELAEKVKEKEDNFPFIFFDSSKQEIQ
jgi:hypothetical protein